MSMEGSPYQLLKHMVKSTQLHREVLVQDQYWYMVRLTVRQVRREYRNQLNYTHTHINTELLSECVSPKIHTENLMSSVKILEGGPLGDNQIMKVEPSRMRINALTVRTHRAPQLLLPCQNTVKSLTQESSNRKLSKLRTCFPMSNHTIQFTCLVDIVTCMHPL